MLRLFFSFVQRKALSFRSAQKMAIQVLKAKQRHAAFYLKYAKALAPYSSKQAAIFTAMGLQELENYKQLMYLSCGNHAKVIDSACAHRALVNHALVTRKNLIRMLEAKRQIKPQKTIKNAQTAAFNMDSTWSCWLNGWLCLHPCTNLCSSFCHW